MNLHQLQTHSRFRFVLSGFVVIFAVFLCSVSYAAQDPLPSWNDGSAKTAILGFVAALTEKGGKDYVEPAERIAVFDHDGTLWVEYPMYTQILFAFERVKQLAPAAPGMENHPAFQSAAGRRHEDGRRLRQEGADVLRRSPRHRKISGRPYRCYCPC